MKKLFTILLILTGLYASAQAPYPLPYATINAGLNTSSIFNIKGLLDIRGIVAGSTSDSVLVIVNGRVKKVPSLNTALSAYVPYTGATGNVSLGIRSINATDGTISNTLSSSLISSTDGSMLTTIDPYTVIVSNGTYRTESAPRTFTYYKTSGGGATLSVTAPNLTSNRTVKYQNKSYTIADSADVAAVSALNLQGITNNGATTTNTMTVNKNPGTGTYSEGFVLENTDLTTGAQWSPSVYWKGTRSGATSMGFQAYFQPTTSGAGNMRFDFFNGTTRLNMFSISSLGNFQLYNGSGFTGTFSPASITANRSYTLPDAGGTLALTSNLTSLVPYTGATTVLDMGFYDIKSYGTISQYDGTDPNRHADLQNNLLQIFNGSGNRSFVGNSGSGTTEIGNESGGLGTSLLFPVPTGANIITLPNRTGTVALDADFEADSYFLSMLDPGDNPVTFTDGGGLYRLHYMRVQNQVTVDVDVAQLTTSWLANDNFSFRINLPILSNFTDYEDLSGNMVIKNQQNAGVNVINFLTVEPDLSPAPYAVISGQYNLPGSDSLVYHIHLMYTVK